MKNLKDKLTTICGVAILVAGTVVAVASGGVAIPAVVAISAKTIGIIAISVMGYLSGKNSDGSEKTDKQINEVLKNK